MENLLPEIERAQDLMRQFDSVRPVIEAMQRQKDLFREVSEGLKFSAPALEAAKNLTAVSHAVKDAMLVDTSMLDIGKSIAAQMDTAAAMKSALQVDTSVLDAAKSLSAVSDAMKDAVRVDTSMLDIGKTIAGQMDAAAAMRAALKIDTSALDAGKNLTLASDAIRNAMLVDTSAFAMTKALTAQVDAAVAMKAALQIDTSALDWAKTIAPQFDATRSMVAALQRAVPKFPRFELSPGIHEAIRSLSAMNIAPQLAAALEPPASLAALLRDVGGTYGTSFAVPKALLEAQRAAASIGSSMRLGDLTPEHFGVFVEGEADEAWLRLIAKAHAIADDETAGPEDVIALAEDADALADAVPPQAKGLVVVIFQMVLLALVVDLMKDGIKAGGTMLLPYLMALPLMFQPPIPPALPPAPAPFSAPVLPQGPGGALGIPRTWEIAGLPAIIRRAGPEAERRTVEFFETGIGNRNTRQAYAQAVMRFMNWCDDRNLELADITVFTVTAYADEMTREYAARTVQQHLGAIRGLFDHLVTGKVVPVNPASPVRGPRDAAPKTKTKAAVLQPQEIRLLLDSVDVSDCSGLRDRALIATMAFGFARVSAVVAMDVEDCFARDGQDWLRLHDRNGTYEIPLHPKARAYLDAYLAAAGIGGEPDFPLWRTMTKERTFSGERMSRVDVFRMVKRRLRDADLPEAANCDSIRTAGIASYLANGGAFGRATMRIERGEGLTPAEIARIGI